MKKSDKTKEKVLSNILSGIQLPIENEPIDKETLLKIIDNIAAEIANSKKLANQSLYDRQF